MSPARFPVRDADAMEALVTDQYLDALLAAGDVAPGRTGETPDGHAAAAPSQALRDAADVIRASLVRVHPSFRFEERLAARLAEFTAAGTAESVAAVGSRSARLIPFPSAAGVPALTGDPLLRAVLDGRLDPADEEAVARADRSWSPARPLIVGGALTSAAISLVGVALVAWRASRPNGSTMAAAVREAHARRLAELAELAAGVHGGPA